MFLYFCVFSSLVVVVVSQIKLLCSGFCFLLFWVSWVCLCVMCRVFLVCFWFLLFYFFGGLKGQVGPKGHLVAETLCYFFCCGFVSVCVAFVVLVLVLFCLVVAIDAI